MYNIKRPSKSDNEEDLLKFQEDFMKQIKNDSNLPTKLSVKLKKNITNFSTVEDVSAIKIQQEEPKTEILQHELDKHDHSLPKIINDITENRSTHNITFPSIINRGFPAALSVNLEELERQAKATPTKKKSLFALHMENKGKLNKLDAESLAPPIMFPTTNINNNDVINENNSTLITGEGLATSNPRIEVQKIHEENLARLRNLSKEEIMKEQERISASVSPEILNFLKNRKRKPVSSQNTGVPIPTSSQTILSNDVIQNALNINDSTEQQLDDNIKGILSESKKRKWQNFDSIEFDKLKWMQKSDLKNNDTRQNLTARFDFEGNLIPEGAQLPEYLGLHHHELEMSQPGYALDELIHLSKSSFQSQKMASLQILAAIAKTAQNSIDINRVLGINLLTELVEIGVPVIFRIAMDSNVLSIICLGILGIRNLLVNNRDIEFLKQIEACELGKSIPFLNSNSKSPSIDKNDTDDENNINELDILSQDVVQGLIRMTILQRIRYILKQCDLPAITVVYCLEVLDYFARYSKASASQVLSTDKLCDVIIENFVPIGSIEVGCESGTYGLPCLQAFLLCKHLMKASKNCALILAEKFKLIERVIKFAILDAKNFTVEKQERTYELAVESLRIMSIAACYGLGAEYFIGSYQLMVAKIQGYLSVWSIGNQKELSVLTAIIHYIGDISISLACSSQMKIEIIDTFKKLFFQIAKKCCTTIEIDKTHLILVTTLFNFFTKIFSKAVVNSYASPVDALNYIENFLTEIFEPFCKSEPIQSIIQNLIDTSVICQQSIIDGQYISKCISNFMINTFITDDYVIITNCLYSIQCIQSIITTQMRHGSISIISSIPRHQQDMPLYYETILSHLTSNDMRILSPAFYLLEVPIIFMDIYSIFSTGRCQHLSNGNLILQTIVYLLTWLRPGQEAYANQIMHEVLFTPCLYTAGTINKSNHSSHLKSIKQSYLALLPLLGITDVAIDSSNKQYNINYTTDITSLCKPSFTSSLLPIDWITMPIFIVYNTRDDDQCTALFQTKHVNFISNCLNYLLWMEINCPQSLRMVTPTSRLVRVMLTFLLGDIFITQEVNSALIGLLKVYTSDTFLDKLDFQSSLILGVASFTDLYSELLAQFSSNSFGDATFSEYLLLPLLPKEKSKCKHIFWKDNGELFRTFPIRVNQLNMPLERLLTLNENDIQVLVYMMEGLVRNEISPTWSPLLYIVAIHNIKNVICRKPQNFEQVPVVTGFIKGFLFGDEALFIDLIMYNALGVIQYNRDINIQSLHGHLKIHSIYQSKLEHILNNNNNNNNNNGKCDINLRYKCIEFV